MSDVGKYLARRALTPVFVVVGIVCFFVLRYEFKHDVDYDEDGNQVVTKNFEFEDSEESSGYDYHASLPTIMLIQEGGRIDADYDDLRIEILSQNDQNELHMTKLIYQFNSRSDYLDALKYIKSKGKRYIINRQSEIENKYEYKRSSDYNDVDFYYEGQRRSCYTMQRNVLHKN